VLLVSSGRRWLGAAIAAGRRRLDDPADFVRLEIELALAARRRRRAGARRGRDHAAAADLPASLAAFSRCQAVELSDTRWRYDVDRLIEMLHARFAIDRIARPRATGRRLRAHPLGRRPDRPRAPPATPDRAAARPVVPATPARLRIPLRGDPVRPPRPPRGIDVELVARGSIGEKAVGVVAGC
jgi:hypothetical protein